MIHCSVWLQFESVVGVVGPPSLLLGVTWDIFLYLFCVILLLVYTLIRR